MVVTSFLDHLHRNSLFEIFPDQSSSQHLLKLLMIFSYLETMDVFLLDLSAAFHIADRSLQA